MKDPEKKQEPFLFRWSRLKAQTRETEAKPPEKPENPSKPKPDLPPVDALTMDSDFSGFLHPEVEEDLRRAALRKLFSDSHFNQMDGLDVYIEDYSLSDPVPPEMLNRLVQYTNVFGTKEGGDQEPGANTRPDDAPVDNEPQNAQPTDGFASAVKGQSTGSEEPEHHDPLAKPVDKLSQS